MKKKYNLSIKKMLMIFILLFGIITFSPSEVRNYHIKNKIYKEGNIRASQYLVNKNNGDIEYLSGNLHEMYKFSHNSTDQLGALDDYRYIGNDPYNYVYFNCEDIDNQSSDTCEVWRIIGVFNVERKINDIENTEQEVTITEQRIKLVRGIDLATEMQWDNRVCGTCSGNNWGINEWKDSLISTYLNGDYLNSLSVTAKSQIDDAIFYLGGGGPSSNSAESIYNWERGLIRYDESRLKNWQGKIALMYPSDQYLAYGKGDNVFCHDNPSRCSGSRAETNWIYNTNKLEGSNSKKSTWLLSPCTISEEYVFLSGSDGVLYYYGYADDSFGVRPVLYLKSDIKIISGTGKDDDPYKLGIFKEDVQNSNDNEDINSNNQSNDNEDINSNNQSNDNDINNTENNNDNKEIKKDDENINVEISVDNHDNSNKETNVANNVEKSKTVDVPSTSSNVSKILFVVSWILIVIGLAIFCINYFKTKKIK